MERWYFHASQMIVDHGSEFVAVDIWPFMEEMRVKLYFISPGKYQQNLVERAQRTLWSMLRALRVNIDTWKASIAETNFQYIATIHSTTGSIAYLLHYGQQHLVKYIQNRCLPIPH